jgi:hypothetical protein
VPSKGWERNEATTEVSQVGKKQSKERALNHLFAQNAELYNFTPDFWATHE